MNTRESVLANKARYRKSHADKIRKDNAAYRATHKKEISEYLAAYRVNHADEIKEARRIYLAKRTVPSHVKDATKERARRALHAGIKRGVVTRPPTCSECGKAGYIVGHHLDYSKYYGVLWVCPKCHWSLHNQHI